MRSVLSLGIAASLLAFACNQKSPAAPEEQPQSARTASAQEAAQVQPKAPEPAPVPDVKPQPDIKVEPPKETPPPPTEEKDVKAQEPDVKPAQAADIVAPKEPVVLKPYEVPADPNAEFAHMAADEVHKRQRKFAPVPIEWNEKSLSEEDLATVKPLVHACRIVDDLFWQQASHEGLKWRDLLGQVTTQDGRMLFRFLLTNYGAYDRLDANKPFLGTSPKPAGAGYYPVDMTKEEFEKHLAANPADAAAFKSSFTVIERKDGKLVAIPYSEAYKPLIQALSQLLTQAAEKSKNASLVKYLSSRAAAFLSNDYFQSDMDWMDLDSKVEITIGPYEVYEDELFGYKAAFECFLTVRDEEASKKLKVFESWLDKMEKNLPIAEERKNFQRGASSPMVVVDVIYTSGDTRAGIQTIAFNLPNDEKVREQKGSKKVMLRNVMNAKFDKILKPIAARVLSPELLPMLHPDAFFYHTLLHEISHALGPGNIVVNGEKISVNQALKELYSHLEEAKADTLGLYNAFYMIEQGLLELNALDADGKPIADKKLSKDEARKAVVVTFLASIFRSTRFGIHEAHGKANLVIFNYLLNKKAVSFNAEGQLLFDDALLVAAVKDLAADILNIQAEGSYDKAKSFLESNGTIPAPMAKGLAMLEGLPVDIDPLFRLPRL